MTEWAFLCLHVHKELRDYAERPVSFKNLVHVAGTPTRTFLYNLNQTRYKEGYWDCPLSRRLLMHGQEGPWSVCPHQGHTKMKLVVLARTATRGSLFQKLFSEPAGEKPSSGKSLWCYLAGSMCGPSTPESHEKCRCLGPVLFRERGGKTCWGVNKASLLLFLIFSYSDL